MEPAFRLPIHRIAASRTLAGMPISQLHMVRQSNGLTQVGRLTLSLAAIRAMQPARTPSDAQRPMLPVCNHSIQATLVKTAGNGLLLHTSHCRQELTTTIAHSTHGCMEHS